MSRTVLRSGLLAVLSTCAVGVLFAVGSSQNAAAVQIYGAAFSGPDGLSQLYSIDPTTGAATPIGTGIGFERVSGMDFHPISGALYGTGERADASDTPVLITIDTTTGVGTEVTTLNGGFFHSFGDAYADISFRNSDSALYAYLEAGDGLGIIDVVTGALTELGSTGVSCCGNGMAFSSSDTLFHSNDSALYTLDQTFASSTLVALHTFPPADFPRVSAMDFDPVSGTLYGTLTDSGPSSTLVTLNTSNGVVSSIGPTATGMDAIAVIPEPATLLLLGSGLVGISASRGRARRQRL